MQGIATASAEILAYLDLTDEQAERLRSMPAIINLSQGWFIIPPNERILKVARHGLGFSNVIHVQHPTKSDVSQMSVPSLTPVNQQRIVEEELHACREALKELIPWLADQDFNRTRICWYTDTVNGDFIIDHHPHYAGLFVATEGSGHAFKFLPVIGEAVVDRIEGRMERAYQDLWSWPAQRAASDDEVCRQAYIARGGVLD